MINIIDEKQCCGCAACSAVCPEMCIKMQARTLGHLFPCVDTEKCVSCGLCDRVCPMEAEVCKVDFSQKAYAAYSKNTAIRFRGASGGVFETFAEHFLRKGYSVYGAAFDEKLRLRCTEATDEISLIPLMKSKYLQSDMGEKFNDIKKHLQDGKGVLFVSTPCQVVALNQYLGIAYDNLISVDFFCHGVPSQKFFDECLEYDKAKRYRAAEKIDTYTFRVKKTGGVTPHYFTVEYTKSGKQISKTGYYFDSTFYAAFQKYICLRESCYNCRFAGKDRFSDITIGDFHDIDRYIHGINRFDGVSTVIINTQKGKDIFAATKEKLQVYPLDLVRLINDRICFTGGTKRPVSRDEFVDVYNVYGIPGLANRFLNPLGYIRNRIYYSLPRTVKNRIKKHMGV